MSVRSVALGILNSPRKMSIAEAAYMAGMADADGSFFITRATMPDQRRPQFRAALSISNTNFEALREMQQMMGVGSLNCGYRSEANRNWKDKGQLNVRGENLRHVIPQIAPFLIIKGHQASLVQKLMDLKVEWSKINDNWEDQEKLYNECQSLNARGPDNQPAIDLIKPEPVERVCSEKDCAGKHYGFGLCRRHYRWAFESGRWEPGQNRVCAECSKPLPEGSAISKKYCNTACRMKWHRKNGCYTPESLDGARICNVIGCSRPHHAQEMCRRHYMQKWHRENDRKD